VGQTEVAEFESARQEESHFKEKDSQIDVAVGRIAKTVAAFAHAYTANLPGLFASIGSEVGNLTASFGFGDEGTAAEKVVEYQDRRVDGWEALFPCNANDQVIFSLFSIFSLSAWLGSRLGCMARVSSDVGGVRRRERVVRAGAAQEQHRHDEGVGSLLGGLQEVRARVGVHVQGSGRERGGQGGAPPHPLGQDRRAHGSHQRPPTLPLLITRGAADLSCVVSISL
jgi:hypothetical protein